MSKATERFVDGLRYTALGFEFATIIVVAVVVGYHADRYLGSAPLVMIVLIAGGFAGAIRRLLLALKRIRRVG